VPIPTVSSGSAAGSSGGARATLAQILGGFAVLIGLYFAWKNITSTNKNLEIAKEGQITERFTKAIDPLGAVDEHGKLKLEVRLGGIYALERIAQDSEKDHWPIMEILTAYVREHTAAAPNVRDESSDDDVKKPLAKDIQAILMVVGRRTRTYGNGEDESLDLRDAHLERAHFCPRRANLQSRSGLFPLPSTAGGSPAGYSVSSFPLPLNAAPLSISSPLLPRLR
jgi:hypothetical protein